MQKSQSDQPGTIIHCDQALARRLERAEGRSNAEFVDARAKVFPEIGCEWIEVGGTYAMFDGIHSPCTQTFGLGLFDRVTAAGLTRLEQFFQRRGADVFHEVSSLAEPSLLGTLNERGYDPVELSSVLFRPIVSGQSGLSRDDGIQVRHVGSEENDRWVRVNAEGWADAAPGLEDFFLGLGRVNSQRASTHCFLAEKQGEPVAAGAISLFDQVALLAGASTIPKWRRQGAQLALLAERLQFAAERGCDIAMIVTQPGSASQHNAERRGFRIGYTRTKWRSRFATRE
jgi:GNAT superfamily N-acetyltransferase